MNIVFFFFCFLLHVQTHRYNISWTVDSHTPIEEFKLYFRRLPQGHDIDNSIDQQQPLQHHNSQSHRNFGNLMHWSRNDWRDVVLPSVPPSHHYTQGMSYMIRGLDPDQQYEARVQARYICFYIYYSVTLSFNISIQLNSHLNCKSPNEIIYLILKILFSVCFSSSSLFLCTCFSLQKSLRLERYVGKLHVQYIDEW